MLSHMRTTLHLPDELLIEAKMRAAERGTTLTQLFEDALREALARFRTPDASRPDFDLVTCGGSGTLPGIDLDDGAALIDRMEEGDGSP
jgi:hypothetical protein